MIRRNDGNDWLLIAQADHAHLAADVAGAWGNPAVPPLPLADQLVAAIRDHDEGWRQWEQSPEIDAETGRPRDFTEMPMPTATAIWSRSILAAACGGPSHADAVGRFQRFLDSRQMRLTPERAVVLDAALSFRHGFRIDELLRIVASEGVDRSAASEIVKLLERGGVLRSGVDGSLQAAISRAGSSPLGGIWVSRHFTYLAEQARESRREDPRDLAAISRFLAEQHTLRREWTTDSLRDFAGEELERLIETGFRYVQFFDRVSLWLCCAKTTEAVQMELPGREPVRFAPRDSQNIVVEPFPLSAHRLELSVSARRVPARRYDDDDDLRRTIRQAPRERLRWTLRR